MSSVEPSPPPSHLGGRGRTTNCPPSPFGGEARQHHVLPCGLGDYSGRGGETHVSTCASVFASAGGFTAWMAAITAQVRPGVADLPNPQPPYGAIHPHLPWIRGASARVGVACCYARDTSSRDYGRVYHNPRCFSTPPFYSCIRGRDP